MVEPLIEPAGLPDCTEQHQDEDNHSHGHDRSDQSYFHIASFLLESEPAQQKAAALR